MHVGDVSLFGMCAGSTYRSITNLVYDIALCVPGLWCACDTCVCVLPFACWSTAHVLDGWPEGVLMSGECNGHSSQHTEYKFMCQGEMH